MATSVNPLDNGTNTNKTANGTKIIKPGSDMDKNSFLKILSAELSNQDPSKDQDSTAYVSQLAQFAGMEQMTNLNSTMSKFAYQNYVGKAVTVSDKDSSGNPYTGIVQAVTTSSTGTTLSLLVNEDGKNVEKDFDIGDIVSTVNMQDSSLSQLTSLNTNMSFLLVSSLIGKSVSVADTNGDVSGTITGAYKDSSNNIMVNVKNSAGTVNAYSYDKIKSVG